ncbi:hypothetical protein T552_02147 [Pneumocystis carinii B80]|uniref:Uncharacterized protein n=1 Tax=Pneumocystis carinii (strain B80) TaxID=1408658 RepID=A0A0W4ZH56_PNEC8|nr:hypothetical protein T552_02147 [Pneumocystis carinii B80]KTW27707.1 hypothetical protein T552_02147 [Pneumocystis carinii B80]
MASIFQKRSYSERDAVFSGLKSMMVCGSVGLMASAVQSAIAKDSYDIKNVLLRSRNIIMTYALMGGSFSFTEAFVSNLRKKDDPLNAFAGGVVSGSIGAIRVRSLPVVVGYGIGLGCFMGLFDWCGGTLMGLYHDFYGEDSKKLRESLFKVEYRRPRSEIVEAIGSGRGI